jgi:hypothetical protein
LGWEAYEVMTTSCPHSLESVEPVLAFKQKLGSSRHHPPGLHPWKMRVLTIKTSPWAPGAWLVVGDSQFQMMICNGSMFKSDLVCEYACDCVYVLFLSNRLLRENMFHFGKCKKD